MSSTQIPGDGRTFAGHLIRGNFEQIFHHDVPKVLGLADKEAKALLEGWNKLSPELQTALVHGSGIVNEIANDLTAVPADVIDSILAKFTEVKVEDLQTWLAKVQGVFTGVQAAVDQDLATTIENLQAYFKQFEGDKLGGILSTVAQILVSIVSPGSLFAKIATYIETAYRTFIKPQP